MPIFDATSEAEHTGAASPLAWAHTCTGNNLILIVGISARGSNHPSAITYNAVGMTKLDDVTTLSPQITVQLWYLIDPATGSNSISVTHAGTPEIAGGAMSFTGVHQVSPFGTQVKTSGDAGSGSVNVSSAAGQLVVDVFAREDDEAITVGAGQTERVNIVSTRASGTENVALGMSHEPGAATIAMGWSWAAGNREFATIGVPIKGAFIPQVMII